VRHLLAFILRNSRILSDASDADVQETFSFERIALRLLAETISAFREFPPGLLTRMFTCLPFCGYLFEKKMPNAAFTMSAAHATGGNLTPAIAPMHC
jgi:hypothetical protein